MTRQSSRPSAIITGTGSGMFITVLSRPASSLALYSPKLWFMISCVFVGARFTLMFPVEALEASTRSSVSFLSLWDWRSSTARYSLRSSSVPAFCSRST